MPEALSDRALKGRARATLMVANRGYKDFRERRLGELLRTSVRRTSENPVPAKFGEFHLGEDRRKPLPRASVNEPTADAMSFIK